MTSILESLNSGLKRAMKDDARVYIIGEDICDPYGGAFKVTRGLSTAFPERVLTTPVSEAGIVGVAAGMALRGLRPVVEIMFGDFLTLAADQLINHIAKFRWMYNDQVRVPLVIRVPMGARRGYGPTHSQSLEKLFMGVPGLRVLAPSALGDPGDLLYDAILNDDDPVLFIENKLLYLAKIQIAASLSDFMVRQGPVENDPSNGNNPSLLPSPLSHHTYPLSYTLTLRDAPPTTLTLTAYGHMAELARQALIRLAYENEIIAELVVPTQLAPVDIGSTLASLRQTHTLLVAEESNQTMGWGAEVLARSKEALGSNLFRAKRVAARDVPIPASGPLEAAALPDVDDIVRAARELISNHQV